MSINITIQQAYYGEVQRSHGKISASFEDAELNSFLVGFTDRPSSLPAGLELSPYYSAVAFKEYYIVTLTFPDTSAQRGGMVFTHALILKLADLQYLNDFDKLLHYFISHIPQDKTALLAIHTDASDFSVPNSHVAHKAYTQNLITQLEIGKHPILYCGSLKSFAEAIGVVWNGLPIAFRKQISFTAGFSYVAIDQTKTVIYFQPGLEQSIKNHDYISGEREEIVEPASTLEKYIIRPAPLSGLNDFVKSLNVELQNWEELQLCIKAYDAFEKIQHLTADALRQLLRQVAKLSPNPIDGKSIKTKIIARLHENIVSGVDRNYKAFKNFPITAFQEGIKEIGNAFEESVENEFAKTSAFDQVIISDLIQALQDGDIKNWWHNSFEVALQKVIDSFNVNAYHNLWKVFAKYTVLPKAITDFFSNDKRYETSLLRDFPKNLSSQVAKQLCELSAKKSWLVLHANLLILFEPIGDGIRRQLELEDKVEDSERKGTHLLLQKVDDADFLKVTLKTGHSFLVDSYGRNAATNGSLLKRLDVTSPNWLKIWLSSLQVKGDIEHGIPKIADIVEGVLNEVVLDKDVPAALFRFIGQSKFADIYHYKKRKEIWKKLPVSDKNLFLDATAKKLLSCIVSGNEIDESIETELSSYMATDKFLSTLLEKYQDNIEVVIDVYELVDGLKDAYFADYVNYYSREVNDQLSRRLGEMVARKQLRLTAKQIFEKAKHNKDFRHALVGCSSLCDLSKWDKFMWGWLFSGSSSNAGLYQAVLDLALELYDKGPEDREIWKRAGGKINLLHHHSSREENWRQAIGLLQHGSGGKHINIQSLVQTMLEDYPQHAKLHEMEKYLKSNQ
ncbi:effector-associated domain EAD1-containing protein [Asinibacterium sp. OR53]|uniref:GAP1-N1 domain-containing protein n=1 Tax=Asinibacterium sp. OR53 TaxID=925409 RepID=UPI00047B132E|nr:effector-associated domain EAD1-containing protein [Asinibacterium sp. OR53]